MYGNTRDFSSVGWGNHCVRIAIIVGRGPCVVLIHDSWWDVMAQLAIQKDGFHGHG